MPFTPGHVKIGPGTLYAAPLGTTEPTGVSGAWPSGWVEIGYTDKGSTFSFQPTIQPVVVEEEVWPIANKVTAYAGKLMFVIAETTRQNFMIAVNNGVGTGINATGEGSTGPFLWAEPPALGSEKNIMLGWDSLYQGASTGTTPFGRIVIRQCIQSGAVKRNAAKGATKSTFAVEFSMQKPNTGKQPFRYWFPPALAS